MQFNIIGDIAGNYKTLLALIEKMPKTATIISVGDMVDRGPRSKEVVEFFASGKGLAVIGNHEHMFLDAINNPYPYNGQPPVPYYNFGVWFANGGVPTADSYIGKNNIRDISEYLLELKSYVPQKHIDFLTNLPKYLDYGDLFISHAPFNPTLSLEQVSDIGDSCYSRRCGSSLLWNRGKPRRMAGKFQIHGHNSRTQPLWYIDESGKFGLDIDTSRGDANGLKKLSGVHWPSLEIFQQDYID